MSARAWLAALILTYFLLPFAAVGVHIALRVLSERREARRGIAALERYLGSEERTLR